jgi:protease PrsW
MSDRLLAMLGALPPFFLLWAAEVFERRVREPTAGYRYRILAAAGMISIPVAWAQKLFAGHALFSSALNETLFEAFVIAAFVEEVGKYTCLWSLTRKDLAPGSRYGAFLYAVHASMGFATVENVMRLLGTPDLQAFTVRFLIRAYLTVPMHMATAGLVGYLWARRRFDRGVLGLPGGIALAILIHGSFNTLIYGMERLPESAGDWLLVCGAGAVLVPLLGMLALAAAAHRLRRDDRAEGRYDRKSVAPARAAS